MRAKLGSNGFTIVELMIIIVVIGILASVTVLGFRGWQQSIAKAQAKSDLQQLATAVNTQKNFGTDTTFPPASFKGSEDVVVSRVWSGEGKYCVQAYSTNSPSDVFYIDSTQSKEPRAGNCPAAPFPPSSPSPSAVANSTSSITISWPTITNASSYVVRYGTSSPTTLASCSTSPCTVTGLAGGTTYNISVVASNSYGSSTAGTTSVVTTAPAVPAPASSGVTYTTSRVKVGGVFYQRYVITTSGGACSVGATEWKMGVTGGASPSWSSVSWQSSNTKTVDVSETGIYSATDVTIFTRASCVSGANRTEGSPAYAYNGSGGGAGGAL